jgi:hypothetical protein
MRPTAIRTLDPQAGPSLSVVGDTYRIVTSGAQTGGAYAIIDMLVPPGGGPGPTPTPSFTSPSSCSTAKW